MKAIRKSAYFLILLLTAITLAPLLAAGLMIGACLIVAQEMGVAL